MKITRPQRGHGPGQYRRAEAEELYKTSARVGWGGVGVQQEDGAGGGGEEEREQTDKIREPLTEVRELYLPRISFLPDHHRLVLLTTPFQTDLPQRYCSERPFKRTFM